MIELAQIQILIETIRNVFVSVEKQKMRKAIRFWCSSGGCITSRASSLPEFD